MNDNNNVVSVQPHFYADSKAELKRSETEYKGYRLHDILQSFYIAFRSYHTLRRYADRKGIRIYNSTPARISTPSNAKTYNNKSENSPPSTKTSPLKPSMRSGIFAPTVDHGLHIGGIGAEKSISSPVCG